MKANELDSQFMLEAIQELKETPNNVSPNPPVGAVIVKNNKIIGRGNHREYGGDHAEITAIKNCAEDPIDSTIYVTLQPCTHTGKTPPCSEAILKHKFKRIVYAVKDPNPKVKEIDWSAKFKNAGIEITEGVLKEQVKLLIQPFLKSFVSKIPYISLKYAMTLDGKISTSTNDSQWITNEKSRAKVHLLRSKFDGVLIGKNTFEMDNPKLNLRHGAQGKEPYRIVLLSGLKEEYLHSNLCQFNDNRTIFFIKDSPTTELLNQFKQKNVMVMMQQNDINGSLSLLKEMGLQSLLCEGGGVLAGSLLDKDLIDDAHVFIGAKLIGGTGQSPIIGTGLPKMNLAKSFKNINFIHHDSDIEISGQIHLYGEQQ